MAESHSIRYIEVCEVYSKEILAEKGEILKNNNNIIRNHILKAHVTCDFYQK